jgi:hypothetical protein
MTIAKLNVIRIAAGITFVLTSFLVLANVLFMLLAVIPLVVFVWSGFLIDRRSGAYARRMGLAPTRRDESRGKQHG